MKTETATFAGGCFWGMEKLFKELPGVVGTEVGYTGGDFDDPRYEDISFKDTGHAEALKITFDPEKISYKELLDFFFRAHDPTTLNQQGNDVGTQYRSEIFYHSDEQKKEAEEFKKMVDTSGRWKNPVVTKISEAGKWFSAEEYHQDYLEKNPGGYTCHFVRGNSYLDKVKSKK